MNDQLQKKITDLIKSDKVVLFMKGTAEEPRCGFSKVVAHILQKKGVSFTDIDVLSDEELRYGLKEYSNWPTFPQLYVNSELIGGCDIILQLYERDELETVL